MERISDPIDNFRQGLEPAQEAVLEHDFASGGPLLVLAGAGTGKTTTLTRRIALEIARGHSPGTVLALTFTRKAAHEMRERAALLLPAGTPSPEIRTFHSLGLAILSEDGARGWRAAGWNKAPKLLRDEDASTETARFWKRRFAQGKPDIPGAKEWIRMQADWGDPERCATAGGHPHLESWTAWESRKRELGIAEMHDLVSGALLALERDAALLERWRERSATLFVDEYQDTDRTQYRLLSLLAGSSRRLMAVGDDDQAIYGFRGADVRNILDWTSDRPDGRILSLTGNHRCLGPVLEAANLVFPDKPPGFRKILLARRAGAGTTPVWYRALDDAEELRWIRARLEDELRHGAASRELCVLFRGNGEERPLRAALRGLPLSDSTDDDGIRLSTIHAAKGLEWPAVFVAGQDRSPDEGDRLVPCAQDEERRLFYVACTRARDRLYLSSCDRRGDGDGIRPRIPHPWMGLARPALEVRPRPALRWLRKLLRQAAERAVSGG